MASKMLTTENYISLICYGSNSEFVSCVFNSSKYIDSNFATFYHDKDTNEKPHYHAIIKLREGMTYDNLRKIFEVEGRCIIGGSCKVCKNLKTWLLYSSHNYAFCLSKGLYKEYYNYSIEAQLYASTAKFGAFLRDLITDDKSIFMQAFSDGLFYDLKSFSIWFMNSTISMSKYTAFRRVLIDLLEMQEGETLKEIAVNSEKAKNDVSSFYRKEANEYYAFISRELKQKYDSICDDLSNYAQNLDIFNKNMGYKKSFENRKKV